MNVVVKMTTQHRWNPRFKWFSLCFILTSFSALLFIFNEGQKQSLKYQTLITSQPNYEELNLLWKSAKNYLGSKVAVNCTEEYINANRLQQDHPCVIEIIRKLYLHPPSPSNIPYNLSEGPYLLTDPSDGQDTLILQKLMYPTNGFFIECGAYDGELMSNTLYMEALLDWSGILIEADPKSYAALLGKKRKAWSLPVCLSTKPYPTRVNFKSNELMGGILDESIEHLSTTKNNSLLAIQCFPLYSILLAVNRTQIDFFSLDVEGNELEVLKTIPWDLVDIKTFTIEWDHMKEGEKSLIHYMTGTAGYKMFSRFDRNSQDLLFISNKYIKET